VHKYPATFHLGREHTGVVKSIKVHLLDYYDNLLKQSRQKEDQGQFHWVCKHVEEFDLSIYLPLEVMNHPSKKVSSVLVMVNGLNETHNIHYAHYDRIGGYLAPRGVCGILHPTPFHLNRTAYTSSDFKDQYMSYPRDQYKDHQEPLQQKWHTGPGAPTTTRQPHFSLLRKPEAMFYCFEQIAKELTSLARFLRGESEEGFDDHDKRFYDQFFDRGGSLKVGLLGYSLGGLQVLYTFLQEPTLFEYCVLINSGASIGELRPKPVGIGEADWQDVVEKVHDTKPPAEILCWNLLDDILFNDTFEHAEAKRVLSANVHKMLFIAGGADVVTRSQHLARFTLLAQERIPGDQAPSGRLSGPHILQIAGLEHPLHNSAVYDRWFPTIMDYIVNFLRSPGLELEVVSYEEMMQALEEIQIGGEPWDESVGEAGRYLLDPKIDGNLRVDRLLNDLPRLMWERFLKYYMTSKRYFRDDSELIRNLGRRRDERGAGRS
jgi:pimeloyl-ACP methyl ester carboxylesterase